MQNIAVIFGGKSSEHDISILTGVTLLQNLSDIKYNVYPIYINKKGEFLYSKKFKDINTFKKDKIMGKRVTFLPGSNFLFKKCVFCYKKFTKIDFCFNAQHGLNGEDGALSGLLNLCSIAYQNSDIFASAVSMDKILTKYVCEGLKIPVVNFMTVSKKDYIKNEQIVLEKIAQKLQYPIIIKPARLGSSIGITRCNDVDELKGALNLAFVLDENVLIETALTDFKEYNIAVMKLNGEIKLSKIEEPLSSHEVLSFEDKYLSQNKLKGMESLSRKIPADINPKIEKKIKSIATQIYEKINFQGVIRIDFLYDEKLYLNEINSIPGSLANYLWDFSYPTLLDLLLKEGLKNKQNKDEIKYTFESSVLKSGHNKDSLK